jgi:hypothetical protein
MARRRIFWGRWWLFCLIAAAFVQVAQGELVISFHDTPPTPDGDDQFNFVGGSRDGLNVNDENGLDGPLNDSFTYVANDRPRQGQSFRTPAATQVWRVQSIWLRMAGYTNNGFMPEPGFNGTDTDFSAGGVFLLRVRDLEPFGGHLLIEPYLLTGTEANNPNPVRRSSTTNGPGTWMRLALSSGAVDLAPNHLYSFDVTSTAAENRLFEWLGTSNDTYAGGSAYNGTQLGFGSSPTEQAVNPLQGDRVFMVQMSLIPEPGGAALAALGSLALVFRRRFHR